MAKKQIKNDKKTGTFIDLFFKKPIAERIKDQITVDSKDITSGIRFSKINHYFHKPEITEIRSNKRELIIGINQAGKEPGGDLLSTLNKKLKLS